MPATSDTRWIVSVWSNHGHRFMSTDCAEHEACLTCGAMFAIVPDADDPSRGTYQAANGDPAQECTGDTSMNHGYPGERVCEHCEDGSCAHCAHECNCLSCA